MKAPICIPALLMCVMMFLTGLGFAQTKIKVKDFKIRDGTVVKQALVWKVDEWTAEYSFKEKTRDGFGQMPMMSLPSDLRKSLGFTPEKQAAEKERMHAREADADQSKLQEITSIAIKAQTGSAGRKETKTWETSYGSYNKTVDQDRGLEVTVRNATDADGTVMIEVIWLTNGADGNGVASGVSGVSRERVALRARDEKSVFVTKSFSRDHDKYVALGLSFQSGSGYAGWVARAVQPSTGKILGVVATREPLKEWSNRVPVLKK